MNYKIDIEQEEDGRYIAKIVELSGVLVYGNCQQEAIAKVQALALRVLADQLEQGELTENGSSLLFMLNQQTRCQDNILLPQKVRKFLKQ
ncbi:hypothetical protein myaer87_33970 [Microcystis aeruginosa NIES-87]|nr:hypothetical protein myaer87_33970 [Microcystis aeruginosa NIES-87]